MHILGDPQSVQLRNATTTAEASKKYLLLQLRFVHSDASCRRLAAMVTGLVAGVPAHDDVGSGFGPDGRGVPGGAGAGHPLTLRLVAVH